LGAAGVAIDPAPPRGVLAKPQAVITSLPVFTSWMGWRKVHVMSEKAFNSGFANRLTPEEQRNAYATQVVPAPGRIFFQAAFGIASKVQWDNPKRAPLMIMSGTDDRTVPVGMVRANVRKAERAPSRTEYVEYPGRCHFQMAQSGWQDLAAKCAEWTREFAGA
jgi:pimeloyl-ACP methyl ester carboxylesterase